MNANNDNKDAKSTNHPARKRREFAEKWRYFCWKWKKEKMTDRFMIYLTAIIAVGGLIIVGLTCRQMSIYIDATHIENRAYLVASGQIDPPRAGQRLHVRWEIKNVGKTPAYKVKEPVCFGFESAMVDYWIPAINRQVPDTGIVVGSDVVISEDKSLDSTISPVDFSNYQTRKDRVCLFVNVVYEDVFHTLGPYPIL
jgi:hypothetical protein